MNHRLLAAIASGFILSLVSNSVVADDVSKSAVATSYDKTGAILTGITPAWDSEALLHDGATSHQFANLDIYFPPDPCRGIAIAWNIAVFKNAQRSAFDGLLAAAAAKNCTIVYTRSGQFLNGGYHLHSVAPGK